MNLLYAKLLFEKSIMGIIIYQLKNYNQFLNVYLETVQIPFHNYISYNDNDVLYMTHYFCKLLLNARHLKRPFKYLHFIVP